MYQGDTVVLMRRHSSMLAAAAGLLALLHPASAHSNDTHANGGVHAVVDCLEKYYGPTILTAADGQAFTEAIIPFNLRLHYTPALIVYPSNPIELADAVRCASGSHPGYGKAHDSVLKVQARSGGHSYAAFGLGGRNGSMVIDLAKFKDIKVDSNGVAAVGGGNKLGTLAEQLYAQGKRALPHGTCPG